MRPASTNEAAKDTTATVKTHDVCARVQPNSFSSGSTNTLQAYSDPSARFMDTPPTTGSHRFVMSVSGKPDPSSSDPNARPQRNRDDGHQSVPEGTHATLLGQNDFSVHRERKDDRQEQGRHLHREGRTVVALDRLCEEQQNPRWQHHHEAADQP